jgi:molecular chaperone HscC
MDVIGIDLGTTNSLVAVMGDGEPRVLANELNEDLTPSTVAVAEDGTVLVGRAAKDRLVTDPSSGRAFFKRDMGTKTSYRFGGSQWSPIQCSAIILKEMARVAQLHLGPGVERAVVTVPAYFNDNQRKATQTAARLAGLNIVRLVNEPTAAALAYGYLNPEHEQTLLVFDLGGGTFDVTAMRSFEGILEVLSSAGESRLGGEDYTDALLDAVIRENALEVAPGERGRLRQRIEVAKRHLTWQDEYGLDLPDGRVAVTAGSFLKSAARLTACFLPVVTRCMRDAGLGRTDLDDVLLVGGASRMGVVQNFLSDTLGRFGNTSIDPDRAIALGAAVQAALCDRKEAVADIVLTDVCPHTLGVEVAKEFAPGEHRTGYFLPIIERNTTIPVSRAVPLSTLHPHQNELTVDVYQGEGRLVSENTLLGRLRLGGVRHRVGQAAPGEVEVRFSYDMNGLLEVEALVVSTGKKHAKIIEQRPGALTKAEIQATLERLKPLKTHPRNEPENRAVLERAYRLYAELSGDARAVLSGILDEFEAALERQDAVQAAVSRASLAEFVRGFYAEEGEDQPEQESGG